MDPNQADGTNNELAKNKEKRGKKMGGEKKRELNSEHDYVS